MFPSLCLGKREFGKGCLTAVMLFSMAVAASARNGVVCSENVMWGGVKTCPLMK